MKHESSYSHKKPYLYPAQMLGAERHWRGFTMHQRLRTALAETASNYRESKYHVWTESAKRFKLTQLDRMR